VASPSNVAETRIRRATASDIEPAWAILKASSLGPWYELGAEQFRDWWWPSYAGIWVADEDRAVGYSATRGEMVEVYVLQEARRRGIGSRLLLEAEAAVAGPRIDVTARQDEPAAPPFLASHGYEKALETWVMQIELGDETPPPSWPEGMAPRTFLLDDAVAVKDLLDAAYAGEPDFVDRPFAEWKSFMLGDPSFDPESWFLVQAPDGSLAAAALNWREGFLKDLVVHPDQQGRGLGKALLLHTFDHFRSRGEGRLTLKTGSLNTSQASRFYEHMGMRKIRTYDEWQKRR
jgi:ribosomal protein S18 acetylase RimI-like enzyme